MSKTNGPSLGRQMRIATLRASISMAKMAVLMGRASAWMPPADRTALHELEYRRLPRMEAELRSLDALA